MHSLLEKCLNDEVASAQAVSAAICRHGPSFVRDVAAGRADSRPAKRTYDTRCWKDTTDVNSSKVLQRPASADGSQGKVCYLQIQ